MSYTVIDDINTSWISNPKFTNYLSTFCTMTVNTIIIPYLIYLLVLFEDHRTKSDRHLAVLNRNFFFMMLNSLLLPLTGLTSIKAFFQAIKEQDLVDWPAYFSANLLTTYNYFITYFIQLTFLSVGFWLLDLPHFFYTYFDKKLHNLQQRSKRAKKPYVDTYAFDLGYHSAYSLTAFAIMLLFSTIVPYLAMAAGIFFVFKYNVDKYNIAFVYPSEYKGLGVIYKRLVPLSIFTIFMFQIINIGLFTAKTPVSRRQLYFWGGFGFVIFEFMVVLAVSISISMQKKWKHFYHRQVDRS